MDFILFWNIMLSLNCLWLQLPSVSISSFCQKLFSQNPQMEKVHRTVFRLHSSAAPSSLWFQLSTSLCGFCPGWEFWFISLKNYMISILQPFYYFPWVPSTRVQNSLQLSHACWSIASNTISRMFLYNF